MKEKDTLGTKQRKQEPGSATQGRNRLPWGTLEQQVVRVQKQIAQASQHGDRQATHTLQQKLLESEAARLLAVRRVAEENQGRDTAGVDGVKSLTTEQQLAMAEAIHPRNWSHQPPMPGRRVWIAKPGTTERRPLSILSMIDRCKQALVKLALEPEWETKFEAHSYGFRPGRSVHDALAALLVFIEHHPMFVLHTDIEGAFEHVNQMVILDKLQTYPMLREALTSWLKAGVIDGNTYVASKTGIPQGGVLSPLLMNIALHGMEMVVAQGSAREKPLLVRYADDFVILHSDLRELKQAIRRVQHWLAMMGLQFHEDKTRISHTLTPYQGQAGFDFLGFHIRQESKEVHLSGRRESFLSLESKPLTPSLVNRHASAKSLPMIQTVVSPGQEASKRHLATLDHKLQQLQTAPQTRVIEELNPLITGWAAYYNGVVEASTMSHYDHLLEQRLLSWAKRRHPGKTRDWLLSRYWQRGGEQNMVFATSNGVQLRAYQHISLLKRL